MSKQYVVKGQTGVSSFNFIIVNADSTKDAWTKSLEMAKSKYRLWIVVSVEEN